MLEKILNNNDSDADIDISLMKRYMYCERIDDIEKNEITPFNAVDIGYLNTNESLYLYYEKNLESKKILSVTSSGDHILHAVLAGAKDVTGFDINRIAKYFSALKIAMIKAYDHGEFISKIGFIYRSGLGFKHPKDLILFDNILDKVSNFLTLNEYVFWQEYLNVLKERPGMNRELFFTCDNLVLFKYNAWIIGDNYLKVKENLSDCNITYIDSNVNNLASKISNGFDLIYLSNILGRMSECELDKEVDLLIYLEQILNKNGVIYDYNWWVHSFSKNNELRRFYDVSVSVLEDDSFVYKYIKK